MIELEPNLPNIKWQIGIDKAEEADKLGIRIVEIDSNNTLLEINLKDIPKGMLSMSAGL